MATNHAHRSAISAGLLLMAVASSTAPARNLGDEHPSPPRPRFSFDASTGRDLLNYPPHRSADILHERLELTIPDMNSPQILGVATVRFQPIGSDLETLRLHAAGLFIKATTSTTSDRAVSFRYAPGSDDLDISLSPPLTKGQIAEVRIDYEVTDPAEGIIWTPESPLRPNMPASLHSQGESESNRYWFPTFDFPNERLTSEVLVTVPLGFHAVSNGLLQSRELVSLSGSTASHERFHYVQDQEHAPYLVMLAVGKWDIVDVAPEGSPLSMPVYAPPGQGERVKAVFGRTPKMIALYERLFAEPFPWAKYAQVVVSNFAWGGMENTSATTLFETVVLDKTALLDGDQDDLICHELAHQWFGDLLTCRSWEHIWLNEGWATFSEALWEQYRNANLGRGAASSVPTADLRGDQDAYQQVVWSWFQDVLEHDKTDAPFQPAMVSKQYAHADDVFEREANPYPKGGSVLHMLREKLGESTFWRGVSLYVDRHRNQPVETSQFRLCMEEVSGLSLQRFFDQWCYRPGVPRVSIAAEWDADTKTLTLRATQVQTIDGANPAFAIEVPLLIDCGEAKLQSVVLSGDRREVTTSLQLPRPPRRIVADPELTLLGEVLIDQPPEADVQNLRLGPTLAARLRAIEALADDPGSGGIDALAASARDNKLPRGLRIASIEALGELANPESDSDDTSDPRAASSREPKPAPRPEAFASLQTLVRTSITDARVRAAVARALGRAGKVAERDARNPVVAALMDVWKKDPSYGVRAACLRSLGEMKAVDAIDLLIAGLSTESQHDQIRQAAIEGWRDSEFPEALDHIAPFTTAAHDHTLRVAATEAIGKLAQQDRERSFNLLAALMNDRDLRTRRAAVQTMLDLDDPRALPTVDQWTDAARSRADRLWGRQLVIEHELKKQAESHP